MLSGAATVLAFYIIGALPQIKDAMIGGSPDFRPYFLLGIEPMLWGLAVSMVLGIGVSLFTQPPTEKHVSSLFDAEPAK